MQIEYVINYIISLNLMGFRSWIPRVGFVLLTVLLIVGRVETVKPAPRCEQRPYYKILPMISNESAILNLDNIFDGYNLNFTLSGHEEWKNLITLGEKRKLLK
jgi:hypothetical protein